jgi:CRISPR type II-A-associated protein Csn2
MLLDSNAVNLLVIENPNLFYEYVMDLKNQANGESGRFVFSKANDILKVESSMENITDTFNISHNSKKIQTSLFKLITKNVQNTDLQIGFLENCNSFVGFLQDIEQTVNLELAFDDEIELQSILKAFNVRIKEQYDSLVQKIISYVNVLVEVSRVEVLCLVNIKSVLSAEDLQELFKHCSYQKVSLLLIEYVIKQPLAEFEKAIVIDKDLCEILVNY